MLCFRALKQHSRSKMTLFFDVLLLFIASLSLSAVCVAAHVVCLWCLFGSILFDFRARSRADTGETLCTLRPSPHRRVCWRARERQARRTVVSVYARALQVFVGCPSAIGPACQQALMAIGDQILNRASMTSIAVGLCCALRARCGPGGGVCVTPRAARFQPWRP